MQLAEKQELVRLLNLYQAELLEQNQKNTEEAKTHKRHEPKDYITFCVKAQYNHARFISKKLSVELGKKVKSMVSLNIFEEVDDDKTDEED
ncbi:MAG: hypothetical protein ACOYBH_02030 [Candidatus Alectryocaccobium sp.]